jgi:hypothetical protein
MSPFAMPRPCRGAPVPCTAAIAGSDAAATEAAPRLQRKDLRERADLNSLLMGKLLKDRWKGQSRHRCGRGMSQLGRNTGSASWRLHWLESGLWEVQVRNSNLFSNMYQIYNRFIDFETNPDENSPLLPPE